MRRANLILAITIAVGLALCVHGITTGNSHPDQMAFVPIFLEDELPFNPNWFEKPPFHTYFNYFLSVLPISLIERALDLPPDALATERVLWSKLLTAFLFLGSVALIFNITKRAFGTASALIVAMIAATSAGFIAHSHFLTADIPVMFWMLVAFYFSRNILVRGSYSDYALAGFFTGIATATKYNGLGIGITIVVAHLLSARPALTRTRYWKELLFSGRLVGGLAMVPIGFIVGNPFSILDFRTFRNDFIYNYRVAPVYEGQTGHSFAWFFGAVVEVIGLPAFTVAMISLAIAAYLIVTRKERGIAEKTAILALSALLLYYVQFAPFPRLETRFVLPIVPLLLIVSGLFWSGLKRYRWILVPVVAGIVGYNLVCSYYVGKRFLDDPRMPAEQWVKNNVPPNSSIESDIYSPDWSASSGLELQETIGPFVTGRERLFAEIFPGNRFINGDDDDRQRAEERVAWYSLDQLNARNPDFIAINSLYYARFVEPGRRRDLYPSMHEYFQSLLDETYPYEIVFDQESTSYPGWVYPREIDFLHNRTIILAREELASSR